MTKIKRRWLGRYLPLMIAMVGVMPPVVNAADVEVGAPSSNQVVVGEEEYSVNGDTSEYDGELERVYGGGDEENTSDAVENTVEINGGVISDGVIGAISSAGTASRNRIVINGGVISNVTGGLTYFDYDYQNSVGSVEGNVIEIKGGTVGNISGGEIGRSYSDDSATPSNVYFSQRPRVSNNRVVIHPDGTITGVVAGGIAWNGAVTDNTIEINGGTFHDSIIGGWVQNPNGYYSIGGNTVEINGSPDLVDAWLIGGLLGEIDSGTYSPSGNTLNINTTDITARNFAGFENINFNLPEDARAGSTVLTLTEGTTDLSNMYLTVNAHGGSAIDTGSNIKLITNTDGGLNFRSASGSLADVADDENFVRYEDLRMSSTMTKGASFDYDVNYEFTSDGIAAVVGERRNAEESVAPLVPIINDPIRVPTYFSTEQENKPSDDITQDVQSSDLNQMHESRGFEVFGNVGGGHLKTKSGNGARVKSDMGAYDIGFARHFKHDSGVLTFAPVVEYGHGSYDVYPSNGINGHGKQRYVAGGVVLREFNDSGFYYEGSVRAGRNDTKYHSDSYERGGQLVYTSYHADSPVLNAHVRVGNQFRMDKNNLLDVYSFYAYSRQNGTSVHLNLGDEVHFSSADSGRLRAGYRLTSRLSRISQIYTGLAYQYDTNSDSSTRCEGEVISNSGRSGSSGMLELGWLVKPLSRSPWMIDIHTTGWIGLQEGFTATAKLKKAF